MRRSHRIVITIVIVLLFAAGIIAMESLQKGKYVDMATTVSNYQVTTARITIWEDADHTVIEIDPGQFDEINALFAPLEKRDFKRLDKAVSSSGEYSLYIRWENQSELILTDTGTKDLYQIATDSITGKQLSGTYGISSTDITDFINKAGGFNQS